MNRKLSGRQGDVGFVKCAIPTAAQRIKVRPFALGESTGHAHQLVEADREGVEMYEFVEDGATKTYLRVIQDGGVSIQHEDHDPAAAISKLPAGWEGEVAIAQEYHPEAIRSVVD